MPLGPYPGCLSCTIKGKVTDRQNKPLGGVDIEWDPFGIGFFMKIAETDLNGNFTTPLVPIPNGDSRQIIKANHKSVNTEQVLYPRVSPNVISVVNFSI